MSIRNLDYVLEGFYSKTSPPASILPQLGFDMLSETNGGWFDAGNYAKATIQIVGGSGITQGQLILEQTNDPSIAGAAIAWPLVSISSGSGSIVSSEFFVTANSSLLVSGEVVCRFVRLRVSQSFVGGNVFVSFLFGKNADSVQQSILSGRLPAVTPNGMPVDVLGTPARFTPQTLTGTSQSVALLSTTRRVSVDVSVNAIVRLNAAASVPANGSSLTNAFAIPAGTKDFDVPASCTLHFIRDGSVDGTIRISEIV